MDARSRRPIRTIKVLGSHVGHGTGLPHLLSDPRKGTVSRKRVEGNAHQLDAPCRSAVRRAHQARRSTRTAS